MKMIPLAIATLSLTVLSACGGGAWFGDRGDPPLPGERIPVLELQRTLEPDDIVLSAQGFIAPPVWQNEFWPQAGGYPNHSMQHLSLNPGPLSLAWQARIGEGATRRIPLTAQPVIADGRVFTQDRSHNLTAFDVTNGRQLWRVNVRKRGERNDVIGGGVAYGRGMVFVTGGYNEIQALDPENGALIWQADLPGPARAAPTVMDDRVFVTTLDNTIVALNRTNGEFLWDYAGLPETAALIGAASPAATASLVVPAFSSGEIYALQIENGTVIWSEDLSPLRQTVGVGAIPEVRGLPVIDRGLVIAVSFGGRMVAIDERTGERVWQREIGSAETPWVVGNNIFVVTTNNELVAMGRESGAIRWVRQLARFENPERRTNPLLWTGPVFAGGRVLLASSNGQLVEVDPEDGAIIRETRIGKRVSLPLAVAGDTLYILADDGTLLAYR